MSKLYDLEEWNVKERIIDIIKDYPWEFFKELLKGEQIGVETIDYIITIKKKGD